MRLASLIFITPESHSGFINVGDVRGISMNSQRLSVAHFSSQVEYFTIEVGALAYNLGVIVSHMQCLNQENTHLFVILGLPQSS